MAIIRDRNRARACLRLVTVSEPTRTQEGSMNCAAAAPTASRLIFRISILAVLAVFGVGSATLHAQSAKQYYKMGQAAEQQGDYDGAFNDYSKAFSMAPTNLYYKEAYYRVRGPASSGHLMTGRRLLQNGDEQGALMEFLRASEVDPGNEAASQEIAKVRALHNEQLPGGPPSPLESIASPTELKPMSNEPLTLHMVEDSKIVYQAIGKAAGVNVLFDPDYVGKRIQVDLNNVSLLEALRIVGTLSGTFWRPVTSNTLFVAANTRSKRTELDEQAVQTFYLANAWQQNDLQDVQTAIRNVLPNSHAYGVASQNAIVMRGTPDELLLAQKLVNDLDRARPEVVVDLAVLEVSKNWERTLGIAWPQSASVQIVSPNTSTTTSGTTSGTTTTTTTPPTLYNLAHLTANNFAVTIGAATANALLNDSNTKILQNPRIRATDAQKATMKIGSRIPIATGSFQSGVGVAAAVTPLAETQFQYIDIGVVIDMTPTVHIDHDVTLKMAIEVSSEAGNVTISGVTEPIIAQKKTEQTIRIREGEATVLGGILNTQDIQSWTGLPGLSSIPILKYLFGSKDHQIMDDEIVFLLIPHIVRSPDLSPVNLRPIDTGAGQSIELRHISAESVGPISAAPPAVRPVGQPALGVVPGQTAQVAAGAAISQLRSTADTGPQAENPPVVQPPPGTPPPQTAAPPAPTQPAPSAATQAAPLAPPPGTLRFSLVPSSGSSVANGTTFQVPIVITGAKDIASVPLQVHYDPAKLALVNVGDGDFLGRDGQAVALVHRDDGQGGIKVNASRPPGAAGMSGAGVVCVLSFQAKGAGDTTISLLQPAAMNSGQQPVQADAAQATITVK
jgi:general secretion pathway protein D